MKTPQPKTPQLAEALSLNGQLYLKREDLNPYSSHKGRSIPVMIDHYLNQNRNKFVISSSGNAALAAIKKIKEINEPANLTVFIGKNINSNKEKRLKQEVSGYKQISIEQKQRPKQIAFQKDKKETIIYLRQSTDDVALEGYKELARELNEIENLQAIFVPTSSGTTAEGLYKGFQKLNQDPQIHIVQTEYCHPMAEKFDKKFEKKDSSIATAIVDKVAHRKQQVLNIISKSGGSGWIISDQRIQQAIDLVEDVSDLQISANSALSIAGIKKAIQNEYQWNGAVAALICGK
ncbi:MAG: hypothetical protein BRC22_00430 [Parcubacteria group bacterium QH_9_35_7]|nr:MAG: hypothetical protein BRC22_00430 [Parcubacteria group bacterium QH_9_35_7]